MSNVYLKFGDVSGDSTHGGHEGWIDVESIHWGISRVVNTEVGSANNRIGKHPSISEVTVSKFMDRSSPELFDDILISSNGRTATIHVCSSSDIIYCTYTLENCLVSNISTSTGGDKPVETVTLNFTKFTVSYANYDQTGRQTGQTVKGYDVATGRKV